MEHNGGSRIPDTADLATVLDSQISLTFELLMFYRLLRGNARRSGTLDMSNEHVIAFNQVVVRQGQIHARLMRHMASEAMERAVHRQEADEQLTTDYEVRLADRLEKLAEITNSAREPSATVRLREQRAQRLAQV